MSSASQPLVVVSDESAEDWEEWDGRSPFWAHCVAGSMAGVVEHAAIYPLDTVRTHIQVCAACVQRTSNSHHKFTALAAHTEGSTLLRSTAAKAAAAAQQQQHQRLPLGMWQTIRYLVSEPVLVSAEQSVSGGRMQAMSELAKPAAVAANVTVGWTRLFRGIQTILIGCIPAHALYFSSYEIVKASFLNEHGQVSTLGSSLAGAAAVTSHDLVMTPLDTLKQRLQIGHYAGAREAAHAIWKHEGFVALYRSFPITLLSNVPYGMLMVSTHEACKQALREQAPDRPQWQVVLAASSIAGSVASSVTTPLDRIKTALQTQQLAPVCPARQALCPLTAKHAPAKHLNWRQAATTIWMEEGAAGFFRGMAPRILSHTPAVAISWTTYETAKHYLLSQH